MTIVYYIPTVYWGGREQYVFELAKNMRERYNGKVVFILPQKTPEMMFERFQSLGECIRFRFSDGWFCSGYRAQRALAKLLDIYQADILHINSPQHFSQAAGAKKIVKHPFRIVATQHFVQEANNSSCWKKRYKQIDHLICVSQRVKNVYLAPFNEEKVFPNVHIIYNSVALEHPHCIANQEVDVPVVFYHGRICQEKGVFVLIHALEQLKNTPFRLALAGNIEPKDQAAWDNILQTSPIRNCIEYLGFRTDIHKLIQQFQIGVVPSIVREAGSLTLLENMALGLPTITSDNGSQYEFIRHYENGLLCPSCEGLYWTDALALLLNNPELRIRFAKKAQEDFFANYTYDKVLRQIYDIYSGQ